MKATGIVRRIDDLGRIVIPKEIRKNMRIHEGEPVEIFMQGEQNIVLKKYSHISTIHRYAENIAGALSECANISVMIFDRDVVFVSAGMKTDYTGQSVTDKIQQIFEQRKTVCFNYGYPVCEGLCKEEHKLSCIKPIAIEGDIVAGIAVFAEDGGSADSLKFYADLGTQLLVKILE